MSIIVSGCGHSLSKADLSDANIAKVIKAGEFTQAEKLIKMKIATEELTPAQIWDLNFQIEVMDRIRQDFSRDDSTVFAQLQKYYPEVTREQMAVILYNYAKFKGIDTSAADASKFGAFTDKASVSSWAVDAMTWATSIGIINGMGDNTLAPKDSSTRAQVAQIIKNYTDKVA
jgi:hypothetical protein